MSSYLITGTSQGLGLSIVKVLASRPSSQVSTIIATSRRDAPPAPLADIINASSGRVTHITLDTDSDASVSRAAQEAATRLGDRGLDVLVNNAALTSQHFTPNMWEVEHLEPCFKTNVVGVHRVTKAFLSLLRQGTKKQIMNVSSTQGSLGRAMMDMHVKAVAPDYKISKAAENMLTLQWANSLAAEGFCVQAISPGHLQTNLGTGSGKINADLPADVGAESVVLAMEDSEAADNGRFRDINVKGWHHRYSGTDPKW